MQTHDGPNIIIPQVPAILLRCQ